LVHREPLGHPQYLSIRRCRARRSQSSILHDRLLGQQKFPDRMRRFDFGAVSEKSDDLLQDKWENRKAEWY
jgi:hypothetical protein